ncbi:MAG: DUF4258 domain-containing protein [Chloroflexi bacterium]|nr:DUF4258 domain-containing protein [Chloroflexota bacterium]
MIFKISGHAEEELIRRNIPRRLLEETLNAPQQIVPVYGDKKAYQSQFDFGGGKLYLLRAIVSEEGDSATVVTVYRTSRISKYWRTL